MSKTIWLGRTSFGRPVLAKLTVHESPEFSRFMVMEVKPEIDPGRFCSWLKPGSMLKTDNPRLHESREAAINYIVEELQSQIAIYQKKIRAMQADATPLAEELARLNWQG